MAGGWMPRVPATAPPSRTRSCALPTSPPTRCSSASSAKNAGAVLGRADILPSQAYVLQYACLDLNDAASGVECLVEVIWCMTHYMSGRWLHEPVLQCCHARQEFSLILGSIRCPLVHLHAPKLWPRQGCPARHRCGIAGRRSSWSQRAGIRQSCTFRASPQGSQSACSWPF